MREELLQRVADGEPVSKKWFARYINEVFRKELADQRQRRRFRWLGSAVGVLLPGASLAQDIATEAGLELAETNVGRTKGKYRWYYALQRISTERTKLAMERRRASRRDG